MPADPTIDPLLAPSVTPPIEHIVHALLSPLGADAALSRSVAAEIIRIQEGTVRPFTLEIDPFTGALLACHLNIALEVAPAGSSDRVVVERFLSVLELNVGLSCPALASVIASRRRQQRGGQA